MFEEADLISRLNGLHHRPARIACRSWSRSESSARPAHPSIWDFEEWISCRGLKRKPAGITERHHHDRRGAVPEDRLRRGHLDDALPRARDQGARGLSVATPPLLRRPLPSARRRWPRPRRAQGSTAVQRGLSVAEGKGFVTLPILA